MENEIISYKDVNNIGDLDADKMYLPALNILFIFSLIIFDEFYKSSNNFDLIYLIFSLITASILFNMVYLVSKNKDKLICVDKGIVGDFDVKEDIHVDVRKRMIEDIVKTTYSVKLIKEISGVVLKNIRILDSEKEIINVKKGFESLKNERLSLICRENKNQKEVVALRLGEKFTYKLIEDRARYFWMNLLLTLSLMAVTLIMMVSTKCSTLVLIGNYDICFENLMAIWLLVNGFFILVSHILNAIYSIKMDWKLSDLGKPLEYFN